MTRSRSPFGQFARVVALTIVPILVVSAVEGQGTDAQREACTPDALKLCQATIPDIGKTTACMKAHFTQLSSRCKAAFSGEGGGTKPPVRHARREAVAPDETGSDLANDGFGSTPGVSGLTPGVSGYESQIRSYCREGLIDSFTCRNTLTTLHGAE